MSIIALRSKGAAPAAGTDEVKPEVKEDAKPAASQKEPVDGVGHNAPRPLMDRLFNATHTSSNGLTDRERNRILNGAVSKLDLEVCDMLIGELERLKTMLASMGPGVMEMTSYPAQRAPIGPFALKDIQVIITDQKVVLENRKGGGQTQISYARTDVAGAIAEREEALTTLRACLVEKLASQSKTRTFIETLIDQLGPK